MVLASSSKIQLILFFPLLISECLAYTISFFLPTKRRDLISLFIAGILFSIGISNMLPRAYIFTSSHYPYAGLVSLGIFMLLTLFRFITDGLNSLNDNQISSFEFINSYTVSNQNYQPPTKASLGLLERLILFITNHIVIILLYLIMIIDSISNGVFYNCKIISNETLKKYFSTHIFLKFLEQIVIGLCIKETNVSKLYYLIMVAFLGIIEPLVSIIPCNKGNDLAYPFSGYSLSILLGLYFYIGSRAINDAVTAPHKTHIAWSVTCFLLSFAVPFTMIFALAQLFEVFEKFND